MVKALVTFAAAIVLLGCLTPAPSMKEIEVQVTAPDPAWEISIEEVFEMDDHLAAISRLSRDPDAMAAQVITPIEASVSVAAPDLPVKHFVLGKTWDWAEEDHHFPESEEDLAPVRENGTRIYPDDR